MTSEETTIRELEIKIAAMEQRFRDLRDADARALQLQATEYERRLSNLNNEHARLDRMSSSYVSYSVLAAVVSFVIAAATLWLHH